MTANSAYNPRQVCIVGAGQGKSRIAAATAMFFLKNPKGGNVYILFSDKGLMGRDLEECKSLWKFLGASNSKERNRLKHISDV